MTPKLTPHRWLRARASAFRQNRLLRERIALALFCVGFSMLAMQPAHADFVTTAVNFFYNNFAIGIISMAVLFGGGLLMAGRLGLLVAAGIVAGALVIGNYAAIVSAVVGTGGG